MCIPPEVKIVLTVCSPCHIFVSSLERQNEDEDGAHEEQTADVEIK